MAGLHCGVPATGRLTNPADQPPKDPEILFKDGGPLLTYQSATWAGKFLDVWCTTALRSRIEPMKKIARMCRRHRPLILNWFKAKGRISNGIVEGLNNKARLTIRKSYGFRSPDILEMRLYHTDHPPKDPETLFKDWGPPLNAVQTAGATSV